MAGLGNLCSIQLSYRGDWKSEPFTLSFGKNAEFFERGSLYLSNTLAGDVEDLGGFIKGMNLAIF